MNSKKIHIKIIGAFILLQVLLSYSFIVSSDNPPTLPHRFYGTVKNLDAHTVADGLVVRARIVNLDNHSSQNFTAIVRNSAYDFDTQIYSQDGDTGDIIFFYINTVNTTQSATFIPGGNTELNLIYRVHDEGGETPGGGPGPTGGPTNIAPIANTGGPYGGYINDTITFDGSKSTDADGAIIGYRWDFTNDGTFDTNWLTTPTTTYRYARVGSYRVKLQVKDNGSTTDDDTANVTIKAFPAVSASIQAMNLIQTTFDLQFTEPFYATDTDDDGIVDTFTDPNHLLTLVRVVNISGNIFFLISTGDDMIPEFFWDAYANKTVILFFVPVLMTETWIDPEAEEVLIVFNLEKTGWVYIQIPDPYPPDKYSNFTLTVKTANGRIISSDMIWHENENIYILDDSSEQYILTYGYTILPPIFNPSNGTLLTIARPTITITFFEEIILTVATFNDKDILDQITAIDHKTFIFTPPLDLTDGTYALSLMVKDSEANTLTSTSTYTIITEKIPTAEFPWLIITLIAIILIIVVILAILRMRLVI